MDPAPAKSSTASNGIQATGAIALRIVLTYAVFSGLWILVGDNALGRLFNDPKQIVLASTIKGWLFVAVTSLLLFGFIRSRLEQAMKASQREIEAQTEKARALQLLAMIADNSTDAIFAKDLEGHYLVFNRECARVIGKTAEQVLGSGDMALFPPEQAALIRDNDRRVLADDRINTYEEVLDTVDGRRNFLATKGPLRDGDGRVVGIFGISRDITERQRAETALRGTIEELERFNRLVVGRELDMVRLKQQVNAMSLQLGLPPPYGLNFVEAPGKSAQD